MHTIGSAFYDLKEGLGTLYDEREAAAIAHGAMEHITGMGKLDRLVEKKRSFTEEQELRFVDVAQQLFAGTPLQYVTGEAWFMGELYAVNEHVLIPRPETEELVQWIINDWGTVPSPEVLDIGSGSGCIPIALSKMLNNPRVTSCDVSADALEVAMHNAEVLGRHVEFVHVDFLDPEARSWLGMHDIIVSNPPYIPQTEADRLHVNVRAHEPALALFVPDSDPLVFYRAIAIFGKEHLKQGGAIYCELDAGHAHETAAVFRDLCYSNVELRNDLNDNPRMLCARF
ncbi:MAG: peptide chain release factor N(5)-glutamine methyltransferase [Taibaiella sp.]|nr:peptide chain release factor N(5)-glutamine methyltransferase [Taibaiella sp.]